MDLNDIVIIFNLISCVTKSTAINVALGKNITYCDKLLVSSIINNDDHNDETPVTLTMRCRENAYLTIDLVDKYHVQRVHLTTEGTKLDFFLVKLLIDETYKLCTEYPHRVTRFNMATCRFLPATDKVRIESRRDTGMIIYEVEVLSDGDEGNEEIFHEGCFAEFEGDQHPDDNYMNVSIYECRKLCVDKSIYFGMKNLSGCFCGEAVEIEKEVTSFKCLPCSEKSTLRCGGLTTFSVYKTENRRAYYEGCFRHSMSANRDEWSLAQHLALCMKMCNDKYYFMLKIGKQCFCTNQDTQLLQTKASFTKCDINCSVIATHICGGYESLSVFKTCTYGPYSLPCDKQYRCKVYDPTGACSSPCYYGYTGFGCVQRISDSEGCWAQNACGDQPHSTCMDVNDTYFCKCNQNYKRYEDGICEEDVCLLKSLCVGEQHKICIKQNGTFLCICKEGFVENKQGVCEGNLCLKNMCDDKNNTECKVIDGNFVCVCLEGFSKDDKDNCIRTSCPLNYCAGKPNRKCDIISGLLKCVCVEGFVEDNKKICIESAWKILGLEATYFFIIIGVVPVILISVVLFFLFRRSAAEESN